ncbi:hypothetical protein LSTR_LSTR010993 [Laodelphax striatellus]|uniref:Uncharacterized protein n=1 Tax=Laodelphax striatellus TaxID=195883 RepID=A0A482X4W2_LAOST|nr:hypothetical protein LSTR_LSTR010993 [Laodelphax striatellus]
MRACTHNYHTTLEQGARKVTTPMDGQCASDCLPRRKEKSSRVGSLQQRAPCHWWWGKNSHTSAAAGTADISATKRKSRGRVRKPDNPLPPPT